LIWFSDDGNTPRPEDSAQIQYFSVAQDLKLEQKPIKQRYRLLIQDYSRFVQSKKSSLKSSDIDLLDQMFILRFNNLLNQVSNELKEGKYLSNLLQITDPEIRKAADKFSKEYKLLLKARDNYGYIPRLNQEKVDDSYKLLIAELRKQVFAPVLNLFSHDPADMPDMTNDLDGLTKKVLESNIGTPLTTIYDMIVGFLRKENLDAKVELKDGEISIKI